jgi:hypothetical protein
MTTAQPETGGSGAAPGGRTPVALKFEAAVLPVSDVDRAKSFYSWLLQEITRRLPGRE